MMGAPVFSPGQPSLHKEKYGIIILNMLERSGVRHGNGKSKTTTHWDG
ncbi:hypothetical protein SAMN05421743_12815 [Thalassobacillus cyri]|uniref:Uncharacterized protein n=1 Tax=Thalassobacillus cyri TaxID=571932 RepID=A0A1H4HHH3_9BACI|nr:hypothetical protein SAMN05421743_12815 [Thalassobacillus cyri]